MKVALWTTWQAPNGIALYARDLAAALSRHVEVDLVPVPYGSRDPREMAPIVARLNDADLVHVQHDHRFWGGIAPRASSLAAYHRLIRRPRVVTAHNTRPAVELLRVEAAGSPRRAVARRLLAALPSYRNRVEREPYEGASAVLVHHAAARERLFARGIPAERLHQLPPAIPPPEESDPAVVEALRTRLGLHDSRVVTQFGFTGPEKGHELALRVLARMPPGVRLVIAGPADEATRWYQGNLEASVRQLGLAGRAVVTGDLPVRDLPALMALTDLVLAPYTEEAEWYSVLTTLAYGKPVLASTVPPFPELAQAGCAELFPTGDEAALADRLGFLLASTGARRRLGDSAAGYARAHPWQTVAKRHVGIYHQVLQNGTG